MKKIFLMIIILLVINFFFRTLSLYIKYYKLDNAIEKISSREYSDYYRCEEFSKDLVNELEKVGIKSEIVYGRREGIETEKNLHAIVGVWIDPQNGEFVNNFKKQ